MNDTDVERDRTDWIVIGWLAVLTVVMALALAVVFKQISDNLAAENKQHNEQIAVNHNQILVNQAEIQSSRVRDTKLCVGLQAAWDRSERFVGAIERLNPTVGADLRTQLGKRPNC